MCVQSVMRELSTLKKLSRLRDSRQRNAFLKSCKKHTIYAICEICRNVSRGNLPISNIRKKQLHKYKTHIRNLSKKSLTLKKRKEILNQKGGFLPSLLIPAVTILAQIAAEKLLK